MNRRLFPMLIALLLPLLLTAVLLFATRTQAGGGTACADNICYGTIQEAVSNAPENTPITVTAGTFYENIVITRSVILEGAGSGSDGTIIDGQITDTVIFVNGPVTVSISGVTIQNGDASLDGGGLLNENGTVTLTSSVVQNNIAPIGAGITNNGVMIMDDVIIRDNAAEEFIDNVLVCTDCVGGGISNLGIMTITNSTIQGNSAQYGGGIDNSISGSLMLTNLIIEENVATAAPPDDPSAGGGISNLGTVTITNSTIRDNQAVIGAGIVNDATLSLIGSDVYGNIALTNGGGLHNTFDLTVQTSNIYSNQAGSAGGGGISSESGDVTVAETAVYNNIASGSGGGILHNVAPIAGANSFIITNSTISGNSADGAGGGLRNAGIANTTLQNVTFANNTASAPSSGRAINKFGSDGSVTLLNNNIISGSATPLCSGAVTSTGHNLASDGSCGLNGTADLPNTNPLLGPLQNNGGDTLTHALLLGSPAIDSGSGSDCPATDQRGVTRPFGPACDRGAFEFNTASQSLYLPLVIRP